MSSLLYKVLGSMSGLVLFWSVSPGIRGELSYLSLFTSLVIATIGAPLTSGALAKYGPFTDSPESLFIAAAINGLLILPAARYLSVKSDSKPKEKD